MDRISAGRRGAEVEVGRTEGGGYGMVESGNEIGMDTRGLRIPLV